MHMCCCAYACMWAWPCTCASPLLTLFPHLPIWQLVIDWLLNAPFTHMRTHRNAERKVHYTSISKPVVIVMEDRCKVLGMYLTYVQKYRQTWRQSVLRTYEKRHKITLIPFCWFHMCTDFFPAQISHTHTTGQCSIHLTCLAVADNNDQKSPWEGLVRRWAVPFTKTTHYSIQCLDEWRRRACA